MTSRLFLTIGLSLLALTCFAQAPIQKKSCVLYFERSEHPFWPEVKSLFANTRQVALIKGATPADIINCVQENNPEEILILAHAFEVDAKMMRLGFYSPLPEAQKPLKQAFAIQEMQDFYNRLLKTPEVALCQNFPESSGSCRSKNETVQGAFNALQKVKNLKPSDDLYKLMFGYSKGIFFQKPFQDLLTVVQDGKSADGSPLRLRKIRLMSCEPQKIYAGYPSIERMVRDYGIKLDVAPTNWFQSFVTGKKATTWNSSWLQKSL